MHALVHAHHRASIALTAIVAVTLLVLAAALGTAEEASGGGQPPVGDGGGSVDPVEIGQFDSPVNVAFAPGGTDTLYVVEQGGTVQVKVGMAAPTEFLDISDRTDASNEQGLLGLAFHPKFPARPFVYAYYTKASNGDIVVAEFEATMSDADESSHRKVLRIRHRFAPNHNGGQLLFGPDNKLYMGTGDGGSAGDPRENAQDKRSLLGKLLRIKPVDPPGPRDYRTPKSNPFKGRKGRNEIYALGLRNPFRFTFDPVTERIAIGDVGQDRFEEVDYETPKSLRGANFGWDRWEGFKRFDYPGDNEASRPKRKHHDKPIFAYGQGGCSGGCSVIGGVVVRDESLENLYGRYLFADAFRGELRSLVPKLKRVRGAKYLDQESLGFISSFAADPETDEIYVTTLGGPVFRLEPTLP